MKCSICGHSLVMLPQNEGAICEQCGVRYPLDTLKALVAGEEGQSFAQSASVNANPIAADLPSSSRSGDDDRAPNALLGCWETSIGWSVAGLICASAICAIPYSGVAGNLVTIAYFGFSLVYAMFLYPSLFKDHPYSSSSTVVSFLNFLAGGLVFGALWNHGLTIKKRGFSFLVYAAGSVLLLLAILLSPAYAPSVVDVASSEASQRGDVPTAGSHLPSSEDGGSAEVGGNTEDEKIRFIKNAGDYFAAYPDKDYFDKDDEGVFLRIVSDTPSELEPRIVSLLAYAGYDEKYAQALAASVRQRLEEGKQAEKGDGLEQRGESLEKPFTLTYGFVQPTIDDVYPCFVLRIDLRNL